MEFNLQIPYILNDVTQEDIVASCATFSENRMIGVLDIKNISKMVNNILVSLLYSKAYDVSYYFKEQNSIPAFKQSLRGPLNHLLKYFSKIYTLEYINELKFSDYQEIYLFELLKSDFNFADTNMMIIKMMFSHYCQNISKEIKKPSYIPDYNKEVFIKEVVYEFSEVQILV